MVERMDELERRVVDLCDDVKQGEQRVTKLRDELAQLTAVAEAGDAYEVAMENTDRLVAVAHILGAAIDETPETAAKRVVLERNLYQEEMMRLRGKVDGSP